MSMPAVRQDPAARGPRIAEIADAQQWPGVIISGSCSGAGFVATEVLICTDSLGAEMAIRAWLEAHGIHVRQGDP
jgi:hypothetical protein